MGREPWFDALAQEVIDSQAGQHEFNEAIRIADHWRHVNEDAGVLLTHIVNARESYLSLVRAANAAVDSEGESLMPGRCSEVAPVTGLGPTAYRCQLHFGHDGPHRHKRLQWPVQQPAPQVTTSVGAFLPSAAQGEAT